MTTTTEDPLPDLIRTLRSPMPDTRARAARSLGRLGCLARDALPLLAHALSDPDATVRESAAQAVGQMGADAMPALCRMLSHDDKYVRRNAIWAIGKLGVQAKHLIPDICTALKDNDPRVASGAAQALGNMGSEAAEAVPALTEAMRGTNIVLCRLASKALSQIGRPAINALIAHARHRDPFVRGEAALALGWIGPAAAAAVPALMEAVRPGKPVPGQQSIPLSTQTPTTPVLNSQTLTADDTSRAYAAQALGRIGSAAAIAIPILTLALNDPIDAVRSAARQSLRQIQV